MSIKDALDSRISGNGIAVFVDANLHSIALNLEVINTYLYTRKKGKNVQDMTKPQMIMGVVTGIN